MSEKRRDNKGRLLRSGESQRKDGKYEYKYVDASGVRRSVYSWKLVETDRFPPGKYKCESLRDIEKTISKDIEDGISSHAARHIVLNDLFDAYMDNKYELKPSTRASYKYMYKKYVQDSLDERDIASIKYSDVKRYYISLVNDTGLKPGTLKNIHTILHPIFTTAIRDGYIRSNPTDWVLTDIRKSQNWEITKRHALTVEQQELLINFVAASKTYNRWMNVITVLLGTGGRIGEILGLRWEDCDFKEKIISINHTLLYRQQENGRAETHVTTPKTRAGARVIPMLDGVRMALLAERERQMKIGRCTSVVDVYTNFVFRNRYGEVLNPPAVHRAVIRIIKQYNAEEALRAEEEKRDPNLLPHFSTHNLRHTFCTRFCENEKNIKVIQEIMGHSSITTTMDIYSEATKEKKVESFANLEGKIKIS